MRSSSIKSVIVAVSIILTVFAAVPRAEARPAKPSRSAGITERFQRAVGQLMKRFGISTNNGLPGDPIPVQFDDTETLTTTTTSSPRRQR